VKGFDGKMENAITHLMILSLVVDGRVMYNLPFLIVRLGKHDVILGRMWLAKYGVMVDCARRRLLWPEEVTLKEEIQAKQFMPLPKKLLLRDREIELVHQKDAERRDKAFDRQDVTKPDPMIPRSHGRTYRRSHECELHRMKAELERPLDEPHVRDPTPVAVRGPRRVRFKDAHPEADIALIGAAGFNRSIKSKEDEVFITSLNEIEKAIEDKERPDDEPLEEEEIKEHLPEWYHEFVDVFSKIKSDKLPERKEYDHKIELEKEVELGYCPLYRMSAEELQAAKDYIVENLDKGFIVPSNAPFASPILMAKKPGGGLRFCVDYRRLNAITRKDCYPLPLIDEVFERISRAKIFTKLDIRQGFHRVRMHKDSSDLTTFRCRYGTFKYEVMPFGLTNGPATFQRLINDIFLDCLDKFMIAFIDDLLIYSDNAVEHEIHVRTVLQRLRDAGLQASIKKCEFHVTTTKYLGFIITPEGIQVDPAKVEAVVSWKAPTMVVGVQSFLGFCNFYRKFIAEYSRIARPLHRLTRNDVPFVWTSQCCESFQKLKAALASAPVLVHYDPKRLTRVETDASDGVVAAVLSQLCDDGEWHPVAYYSATMNSAEHNYDIHDKEMLAIIKAFREWRPELLGLQQQERFEVLSDHRALEYFMTTKALSARQVRWYEFIQEFYFILKYRPGKANVLADTLTRRKDEGARNLAHRNLTLLPADCLDEQIVTELAFMDLQEAVKDSNVIDRVLEANERFADTQEARDLIGRKDSKWHVEDHRLLFQDRLYVPDEGDLRARLMDEIHRPPSTAHPGRDKMTKLVRERFYWRSWSADVERYVDNCKTCRRTATWRDRTPGLLQPLPIPERPWQHLSMDFMELPQDRYGFDMVFVTVDRLSKRPVSMPCHKKTTTAKEMARLWIRYVFPWTGLPDSIVSDRGGQFVSEFWNEVCRILRIKIKLSTARHAQTDGQTEIANQYLQQRLRPYVNFAMDDWSEYLPLVDFAAATLPQASVGLSPFMIERGYQPRMSFDWREPVPPRRLTVNEKEAQVWTQRMQKIWAFARGNMERAQERQRVQANKKRRPVNFTVGDEVYVSNEGWDTGRPSRKLGHQQEGPFPIIRQVGHAFELRLPEGMRVHPIFSPEKLRLASAKEPLEGQLEDEGPELQINGQSEWEIERVLASRILRKKLQYRVSWVGRDPDPKWYPASYLKNAPLALKTFHDGNPKAKGPPIRLREWIEAADEDRFAEDHVDDDAPVSDARGQASPKGGSDVTELTTRLRPGARVRST
jgi:hypothetical protein